MRKLIFLTIAIAVILMEINCNPNAFNRYLELQNNFPDSVLFKKAQDIADNIVIIDCHSHSLFRIEDEDEKQVNFSEVEAAHINGIVQSFPVNRNSEGSISEQIIADIISVKDEIKNKFPHVSIAITSGELKNKDSQNNLNVIFGVESFKGLSEGNLSILKKYYEQGVRVIGINNSGDDIIYENNLLTEYGKQYVRELNRLELICDITHVRSSVQSQIIELSDAPVIISHGGAFGAVGSGFNTPDSILIKLADKGGMIGVTFFSGQISDKTFSEIENGVKWNEASRATIDDLIDHIDYLKNLIGVDYIGIGSDYGGSGIMSPSGLETIKGYPLIIYHMLKRGYSESEIEKIMGGNFLQFWGRVEKKS